MSRNYELLRLLHRERELFQRVMPPDTANAHEEEVSRLTQIEKRFCTDATSPTGALAAPESQRSGGSVSGETCKLVQRLFLGASSTALRAVVFSPVEQNNEHQLIAAQVAELLASYTQESICLVDANLADPFLHTYFGVENHGGLTGALLDSGPIENFTKPLERDRLHLMPAGEPSRGTDLSAILASGRLRERISELRARFNFVVVGAPPATSDFITSYLAALTDGLILVVEPRFTPRQAACHAKENVQTAGGRVLGVVLHRREMWFPSWSGHAPEVSKPAWTF
jgi:Mrp family chromosome partitioning ATPase